MGRRALTPAQKIARGNPGKRPLKAKPVARSAIRKAEAALKRPTWLTDKVAQTIWANLQAGESALHFLRTSDVHVFGRYCVYMASWVEANKSIGSSGGPVYETSSKHVENMLRINPWFVVRSRLEDDLVKLEEKLGLTPLDRLRIVKEMAAHVPTPATDLFAAGAAATDEAKDDAPLPGEQSSATADGAVIGGLNRLN